MAAKIVEARLLISGEDRASAAIANVVKTFKDLEAASKVSKPLQEVAKTLLDVEKAERAVGQALGARTGLTNLQGDLTKLQAALSQTSREYDAARKAKSAFDGVKLVKGSAEAQQAAAAAKAVREAGAAHRAAERDVRRATAAVSAQTVTMQQAERAAVAFGADLGQLEAHQIKLRRDIEATTGALRQQIGAEEAAARATAHHAREQEEYARHMRRHGAIGTAATAAAGYVSVHAVSHGISDTLKAGARYQHEVVALQNAGRTPAEMKEIEHASAETTRAVPTATFEENLKVVNETTGAFGDLHHAIENLTFMQKVASVLHASAGDKIHEGAGELGNKLARFFEMRGTAGNTPVFQREAGEMIRAMAFTRGNFNPGEMVNFAQQAKASLPLYNERFLTKIAPSLVTEYGGDRAGTAANAFRNVIMGKANDKKQAEAWRDLGLLDTSQAIMKGGHAVSWKAGAIKDTNTALSDPFEWAEKTLIPALQAHGTNVEDKLELSKALGTLFRNSNSNLFAEALTQQMSRTRLHKDEANINKSGTLEDIYGRNISKDPTVALKAVTASLENLMTTASSPAMEVAASGLNSLATGIQNLSLIAKEHPNLAMGAGGALAAGGFATAATLSYKLMTGFGLSGSASALTASAAALDAAAIKLAGGNILGGPSAAAKGKFPLLFGLGGPIAATAAIGAVMAEYGDASKSVNGTGGRPADSLTLNPGDELPGVSGSTDKPSWVAPKLPSMTMAPGGIPLTLGEGGARFGVGIGPDAYKTGQEAGEKTGKGIVDSLTEKGVDIVNEGLSIFARLKNVFSEGIMIPISLAPGEGLGGGGGGGLIHRASFGGDGGGSGGGGSFPTLRTGGSPGTFRRGSGSGSGAQASLGDGGSGAPVSPSAAFPGVNIGRLPAGMRNNNPGNIKFTSRGAFAGVVGPSRNTDQGDPQAVFDSPESGMRAASALLLRKFNQGRDTINKIVAARGGWTPGNFGAAANIARHSGVGPNERIDLSDPDVRARVLRGLITQEHGPASRLYSDELIRKSVRPRQADPPGPKVPEGQPNPLDRQLPAGGGMGGAADRMHQAIDRLENVGWKSHHTVEVTAGDGLKARTKGMRATATGPVRADVGVSMPHTEGGAWI